MATKAAKPKKAVKTVKTATKATPKKQTTAKKGASYTCSVCGLRVSVDQACGCVDYCDILCCGEQMKPVRGKK
ncbi:MAG: hypothetical protein FIA94_04705 [Nitrospirae bacterium]|nr:hypothetical protein [Nitrospirota bacterium]